MNAPKVSKFKAMDRNMRLLNLSLLTLVLAGTVIFGIQVLFLTLTVIITDLILEIIFAYFRGKQIDEGWLYNALVLVLILPPTVPLWIAAVGAAFGVFFGKLVFGGYPKYVFNPAVIGVIFLMISFPQFLNTQWLNPVTDVIGTSTPIGVWIRGDDVLNTYPLMNLFLGTAPGAVGEVSRGLVILLGLILIVTKVIDWKAPLAFLVSLLGLGYLGQVVGLEGFYDPFIALVVGMAIFGAFFIITDKPTLPVTTGGRFLYGFLFAFFTLLIRVFAAWPEGVIFATIIMNVLSPLLDATVARKPISAILTAEVK
ncbi:MAG: Na+-transporting ubiquinone oxidoreductase subunit [Bacillota bacterium]|jgi:Na+-transporting NADH:ubiquinone oxidoreductase subunit B/electron transport complex protein RnfD